MPGKFRFAIQMGVAAVAAFTLTACTGGGGILGGKFFKERAAETPPPHEEGIEKTFFRNADGTPKNFLCAWSPEIGRGFIGERFLHRLVNEAMHCNLQWEITERYLVGKMVDPTYPNNPELWKTILQIGIVKHYYFERSKDEHGRETNNWIENDSRSHYSARPYLKLNLADIQVLQFTGSEFGSGSKITSVEDIEWDRANNFLGFSANIVFPAPAWAKDEYQARLRFNFMKFDHDASFRKIPYSQENAKLMNILHVMGSKVGGTEQIMYAARWDFSKPKDLYISGANATVAKMLVEAVNRWNTALAGIGAVPAGQKAFNPIVQDLKHPFDLRYSTITWIPEKRIGMNSPLGIGMAHADRRNGKILWGGVVLYGGMLEAYINRYAPVEGAASSANGMLSPFTAFANLIPENFKVLTSLNEYTSSNQTAVQQLYHGKHESLGAGELGEVLSQPLPGDQAEVAALQEQIESMKQQLSSVKDTGPALGKMISTLMRSAKEDQDTITDYFKQENFRQSLTGVTKTPEDQAGLLAQYSPEVAAMMDKANASRIESLLLSASAGASPFFIEQDRTVENMAPQWKAAAAQTGRTHPEMFESVVMDLTLHEIGHMIGLGHQFKENILPKRGTVPNKYVDDLTKLATKEKQFTNYSSVMGYRNGRVEMELPESDLQPGPHDLLVLRYLYNGKITTYDRTTDKWYHNTDVPVSGKIPSTMKTEVATGVFKQLPISYFPACNDYEASLDADPFCNRWDRGSKAEDIVSSYFELVSDNLLGSLFSLVSGGSDHHMQEYRLWMNALGTFSRVRLFYDEMRRRLRSDSKFTAAWDQLRSNSKALFEFSAACAPEKFVPTKYDSLNTLLGDPGIYDLCRANALALKEFRFFLNLPEGDYTRMDHTNRYISGGYLEGDVSRNYGNIMGSWFQLSNFPLKFSAMYTLTTANAYQMRGGWLSRNMFYNNEEDRYIYRTLYPRDYTQLVSNAVINNLRFAATGIDRRTNIGKTILATSGLLPNQKYTSNDAARLPRAYNDMLDQQTQFQITMVGVVITAQQPDVNSNIKAEHYKKFTASLYDPYTDRQTTAREVFVLPRGEVMVWANGMFLYPITKLKFFQKQTGYVIAYKVTYDHEVGDALVQDSVKSALLEKHNDIAKICVDGFARNGLASFFNEAQPEFEGFYIPDGIDAEVGKEKTTSFYDSIDKQFDIYLNGPRDPSDPTGEKRLHDGVDKAIPAGFPLRSMSTICDESMRGIGQVSATAALLNGFWLRITPDYVEK